MHCFPNMPIQKLYKYKYIGYSLEKSHHIELRRDIRSLNFLCVSRNSYYLESLEKIIIMDSKPNAKNFRLYLPGCPSVSNYMHII